MSEQQQSDCIDILIQWQEVVFYRLQIFTDQHIGQCPFCGLWVELGIGSSPNCIKVGELYRSYHLFVSLHYWLFDENREGQICPGFESAPVAYREIVPLKYSTMMPVNPLIDSDARKDEQ